MQLVLMQHVHPRLAFYDTYILSLQHHTAFSPYPDLLDISLVISYSSYNVSNFIFILSCISQNWARLEKRRNTIFFINQYDLSIGKKIRGEHPKKKCVFSIQKCNFQTSIKKKYNFLKSGAIYFFSCFHMFFQYTKSRL